MQRDREIGLNAPRVCIKNTEDQLILLNGDFHSSILPISSHFQCQPHPTPRHLAQGVYSYLPGNNRTALPIIWGNSANCAIMASSFIEDALAFPKC